MLLNFLLPLFLLCCLSVGCGKEESTTSYHEILSEQQNLYDVSADTKNTRSNFLGMQFYQGEAVQLWALANPDDRDIPRFFRGNQLRGNYGKIKPFALDAGIPLA